MGNCYYCNKTLEGRKQVKFCSNKCQMDKRYEKYIISWKKGNVDGSRGIIYKGISSNIRKYLLEKYNNKCLKCGWSKINPITGNVPLEVDHIDGDSTNNSEKNLRLLCPNCHSLTNNFRNLNKGKGRKGRKRTFSN